MPRMNTGKEGIERSAVPKRLLSSILRDGSAVAAKRVYETLIEDAIEVFRSEPTVVEVSARKAVISSDLHGDLDTLRALFTRFPPGRNIHIMLGDFIDRGEKGPELLAALIAAKLAYGKRITMLRGDHESPIGEVHPQTFPRELLEFFGWHGKLYEGIYDRLFPSLPMAAVLNGKYFLVHGGIPIDSPHIEELKHMQKVKNPEENTRIMQMMWNDFRDDQNSGVSRRGDGVFVCGSGALDAFLEKNGLRMVIRGHEHRTGGYSFNRTRNVLTVLTTLTHYGDAAYAAVVDSGGVEGVKINARQ